MTFRLAQISDTHPSAERPHFLPDFQRMRAALGAGRPDLVFDAGDMTVDVADAPDDPGLRPRQPLDPVRFARDREIFGPDLSLLDIPGWRLIGIDALLVGSDLPDAAVQFYLLAGAGAGSIALFLHKPLTLGSPDPDGTYWRVGDPGRDMLARAFGDRFQQRVGTELVGHVEHRLAADGGCTAALMTVDGLALDDIGAMPEVYGPQEPIISSVFGAVSRLAHRGRAAVTSAADPGCGSRLATRPVVLRRRYGASSRSDTPSPSGDPPG